MKRVVKINSNNTFQAFPKLARPQNGSNAVFELCNDGVLIRIVDNNELVNFADKIFTTFKSDGRLLMPQALRKRLQTKDYLELTYNDDGTIFCEAYDNGACDICHRSFDTVKFFSKHICHECCLVAAGLAHIAEYDERNSI